MYFQTLIAHRAQAACGSRYCVSTLSCNGFGNVLLVLASHIHTALARGAFTYIDDNPMRAVLEWPQEFCVTPDDVCRFEERGMVRIQPQQVVNGYLHTDAAFVAIVQELVSHWSSPFKQFYRQHKVPRQKVGVHVRRGRPVSNDPAATNTHRFMGEAALRTVEGILATHESVFLCCDDAETQEIFRAAYPCTVTSPHAPAHSAACSRLELFCALADWRTLAECETVYVPAGGSHAVHMLALYAEGIPSTFSYAAAIAAGTVPTYIFNDGSILRADLDSSDPRLGWTDESFAQVTV